MINKWCENISNDTTGKKWKTETKEELNDKIFKTKPVKFSDILQKLQSLHNRSPHTLKKQLPNSLENTENMSKKLK